MTHVEDTEGELAYEELRTNAERVASHGARAGSGVSTDVTRRRACDNSAMTLIWFIVWLIAGHAGLHFDPVDWWTGTLLLAIALDLGRQHAGPAKRAKQLG